MCASWDGFSQRGDDILTYPACSFAGLRPRLCRPKSQEMFCSAANVSWGAPRHATRTAPPAWRPARSIVKAACLARMSGPGATEGDTHFERATILAAANPLARFHGWTVPGQHTQSLVCRVFCPLESLLESFCVQRNGDGCGRRQDYMKGERCWQEQLVGGVMGNMSGLFCKVELRNSLNLAGGSGGAVGARHLGREC